MTRAREAARLIGNNTFRLDSNNAVGFNSTTPDAMFDINHGLTVAGVSTFTGNVTMEGDLTVQGTTTTLDTTLQEVDLINVQANASVPGLGVTQSGSGKIAAFYDSTTEVFTVRDGGAVAIGNNGAAPGSNSLVEVRSTTGSISSGTLRVSGEKTTTGAVDTGSTLLLSGHDGSNGRDFASLFAGKENGTGSNYSAYLAFGTRTNGSAIAERLRITSAGNVGINETTPQQQLHVHDDTSYHGIFVNGNGAPRINFARSTTTTAEWSVGVDGTDGTRFAIADSADNTAKLTITTGGNVNITGSVTATSFSGSGANLTGLPEGTNVLKAMLFT